MTREALLAEADQISRSILERCAGLPPFQVAAIPEPVRSGSVVRPQLGTWGAVYECNQPWYIAYYVAKERYTQGEVWAKVYPRFKTFDAYDALRDDAVIGTYDTQEGAYEAVRDYFSWIDEEPVGLASNVDAGLQIVRAENV